MGLVISLTRDMPAAAKSKTGAALSLSTSAHAAEPVAPPRLPRIRLFPAVYQLCHISVLKILKSMRHCPVLDADEVEKLHMQACELNEDPNRIDRDAMWMLKRPALWFEAPRSKARQEQFTQYCANEGEDLRAYAIWCLAYDVDDPGCWEKNTAKINTSEIKELCENMQIRFLNFTWLNGSLRSSWQKPRRHRSGPG